MPYPSPVPASPLPVPAASAEPPPIWFLAPEGFFALPLGETPEERARRADDFVRDLFIRGNETLWEPAAPYYASLAELLADTGVSYAAIGLFSTSEDDPSGDSGISRHDLAEGAAQCAFTLAAVPTDHAASDTDMVAQGVLAALSRDPYNDVRWLDLPCGPAVACVTWRQYGVDPAMTESSEGKELVTAQLQIHIPFPTGPFTAVFTVLTAYVDHWRQFCEMTEAILQTVSFTDPLEPDPTSST